MDKREIKCIIAKRAAKELCDGDVVNLGIGLPTLIPKYVDEGIDITLQSENGYIGIKEVSEEEKNKYIVNAGGEPAGISTGGAFFSSDISFGLIRGGHVDVTILGALQVNETGDLANWMIPGKKVPGMGGAMDLLVGAKKVIVAMEHTAKGNPKILKTCTLPLTAKGEVDMIITEMGVFDVTKQGLVLKEINTRYTLEEISAVTEAKFYISEHLCEMNQ